MARTLTALEAPAPRSIIPGRVVTIDTGMSLVDLEAIATGVARLAIASEARPRLLASAARLNLCIADQRTVYGISTGFGPLANRTVAHGDAEALQRNLICHLATGVGAPLSHGESRALLTARLLSILQGWSGASLALVDMMVAVLNHDLAPNVPEKGTVGASGDLTPSAHMALALMGEGSFVSRAGERLDAAETLRRHGLQPFRLDRRDGLALVNGVSAMTGIAALNGVVARRCLGWSLALSVVHAEVLLGRTEAWHDAFSEARRHPGQRRVQESLLSLAAGSGWLDKSLAASRRVEDDAVPVMGRAPQDAYTIRCLPQALGAVRDMLDVHDRIVETELASASDNPIFQEEAPHALHGGNFYGQHVAFASDALFNAVAKIAIVAERQIARLTDEKLNEGLPPFLQPRQPGLQSGFMGAQVTASALLAEIRTRAMPASIQSISTNGANQDIVSMGTIAARKTRDALLDVSRILAIQALANAQAIRLRQAADARTLSRAARWLMPFVNERFAPLLDDRPLSDEIEAMANLIRTTDPIGP
jgi:tyrosine ammonia-lyase